MNDPFWVEGTALDSGLEVFRQAAPPSARSFSASLVAPAGWAYDPTGSEGLAIVTSLVQTAAAGRRDRVELARFLDRHGATITRRVSSETSSVTVWGPSWSFDPLLELLADLVFRPRFDMSDLARVRRQVFERQLRESSQPESRAERELLAMNFPPGHPYRATGLGTRRSVSGLRRSDLARFHRDHFSAEGSMLVVTARPSLADLRRVASAGFAEFARRSPPPTPDVPALRSTGPKERRIPMEGRAQVEILIGGASLPRSDERYPEAFLANEVLGGSLLSRLFQRVRERAGLAYHASSDFDALRWGGHWQARAGTGPERVREAARLVADEVRKIRERPIPSTELRRIRESTIGELPLSIETAQGAHSLAVDVAYHHLGPTFLRAWPATLRAVTPRRIRAVASESMNVAASATVLAGPIPLRD